MVSLGSECRLRLSKRSSQSHPSGIDIGTGRILDYEESVADRRFGSRTILIIEGIDGIRHLSGRSDAGYGRNCKPSVSAVIIEV